jgi:hypothetical protein
VGVSVCRKQVKEANQDTGGKTDGNESRQDESKLKVEQDPVRSDDQISDCRWGDRGRGRVQLQPQDWIGLRLA